jgi:ankyrin repeat protein
MRAPSQQLTYRAFTSPLTLVLACCAVLVSCDSPQEKAAKALTAKGFRVDANGAVLAAQSEDLAALELMQTAGVDFGEKAEKGLTPLLAAFQLDTRAVGPLLTKTPDAALNAADERGRTALSYAWTNNAVAAFQTLLSRGAKPDLTEHPKRSLLLSILSSDAPHLAEPAIQACREASPVFADAMVFAGEIKQEGWMRQMLAKGASGDVWLPASNKSLLRESLELKRPEDFLKLLLARGAQLPAPGNRDAVNPLDIAQEQGNLALAEWILGLGAKPLEKTPNSMNPVDAALQNKQLEFADLYFKNGTSPLPYLPTALAQGNLPLLELSRKHGWNLNNPLTLFNDRVVLPLHYAAEVKNATSIRWLLEQQADPHLPGWHGQDAFITALLAGDATLLKPFLENGYDANKPMLEASKATADFPKLTGSDYFTQWFEKDKDLRPLMLAAAKGQEDIVELLLAHGAKRGAQTRGWKRFAVNFACETENIGCAQLLLGRLRGEKRNTKIVVSIASQKATIYKNGEAIRSCRVSTGRSDFPTPTGQFVISDKQADWMSSIYKVPMPFFMRLSCKDFGLHEGIVSSSRASHGCIRLPKAEAPEFFKLMQIGDPVSIQ